MTMPLNTSLLNRFKIMNICFMGIDANHKMLLAFNNKGPLTTLPLREALPFIRIILLSMVLPEPSS